MDDQEYGVAAQATAGAIQISAHVMGERYSPDLLDDVLRRTTEALVKVLNSGESLQGDLWDTSDDRIEVIARLEEQFSTDDD